MRPLSAIGSLRAINSAQAAYAAACSAVGGYATDLADLLNTILVPPVVNAREHQVYIIHDEKFNATAFSEEACLVVQLYGGEVGAVIDPQFGFAQGRARLPKSLPLIVFHCGRAEEPLIETRFH